MNVWAGKNRKRRKVLGLEKEYIRLLPADPRLSYIDKPIASMRALSRLPDNSVKVFNSDMALFSVSELDFELARPYVQEMYRCLVHHGRLFMTLEFSNAALAQTELEAHGFKVARKRALKRDEWFTVTHREFGHYLKTAHNQDIVQLVAVKRVPKEK